ncbi:MAG: transketolase [Magnetococcales bacterium]|nr:transketolase [Magnetococcales bacterium]
MNLDLDALCVTTLRMLAVDMVEQANSGHPGLPLGAAPMAHVLWSRFLRHDPADPRWPDRDRFILSAGHGSALLYALLHMSGYDLPLEELKRFRQLGSRTPGHPEHGLTPGVECSTGPLGQGLAMGVGMAWAERLLAERFNRPGESALVDHHVYVLASDGDLMEGVVAEAASLAGHQGLGKLVVLYDDNHISIEGSTELTFTEDVEARFRAYGWHTLAVEDGEDLEAIAHAIEAGRAETGRPSLIRVRTRIGHGSPLAGSAAVHGAPLGAERLAATRVFYHWPNESFHVPEAVQHYRVGVIERGLEWSHAWAAQLAAIEAADPVRVAQFREALAGILPDGWDESLARLDFGQKPVATRVASGMAIHALAGGIPALIGGSADLAPSNNTHIQNGGVRNMHFGVREHAMAAIVNGMALHGGWIPFCATFLVFSDYMRGAMRLSALMETRVIYVLTHDSIAVGEDGPTHQPVEQLAGLRALPGLTVLRPADAHETVAAWRLAVSARGPTALILSRQNLPILPVNPEGVARGAYVVDGCSGEPELVLLASGSEVSLAMQVKVRLQSLGHEAIRVVSMPSWELFAVQSAEYRMSVLGSGLRLAMEAGSSLGWHRWVGDQGVVVAVDRFGVSAPGGRAMDVVGLSVEAVVAKVMELISESNQ